MARKQGELEWGGRRSSWLRYRLDVSILAAVQLFPISNGGYRQQAIAFKLITTIWTYNLARTR